MPDDLNQGSAASTGGGGDVTITSTGGGASTGDGGGGGSTISSTGSAYSGSTAASSGGSTASSTGFAWQPGWREHMAAGDEKLLQRLQRFADPSMLVKSYAELERLKSSGQLRTALKDNPTAEELTAWRKENGIPEKPDGYTPPEGLVLGDEDKAVVGKFAEAAHKMNMRPDQFQGAIAWYYEAQDQREAAQADADNKVARETMDALRTDWPGAEYRANMNAVHSLLDGAPQVTLADGSKVQLKDLILGARLPNGIPIGSSPEALRWFAQLSRDINPAATVVLPKGANTMQAIDDELIGLKKLMGNKNSEYWKGPTAEKNQARYRELLEIQEKLKTRGKAAE